MTKRKEVENRIVDKHVGALLDELRANGIEALGMAGGIVIHDESVKIGSACHVFHMVQEDVRPADRPELSEKELIKAFVADVAQTMMRADET